MSRGNLNWRFGSKVFNIFGELEVDFDIAFSTCQLQKSKLVQNQGFVLNFRFLGIF